MLGMRRDWHEPDEQDVDVEVHGEMFDNAGFWPIDGSLEAHEIHVIIRQANMPVAAINLATLLAWASED